jgi:hypothetical protein
MFDTLFSLSFSDLDSIARKSGLILRRFLKFSASGFLLALLRSVTKGDASLSHLAMQLGTLQSSAMSRQGMHKRFSPASSAFLRWLNARYLLFQLARTQKGSVP